MSSQRKILRNGTVLTLDRQIGSFQQADVLIEGSKIVAVGPNLPADAAEVIDASNMIVTPGFVDTHRHVWQGILRNIAVDTPLADYFQHVLGALGPVYRPQDAYIGNLVAALGAIDAGITTILDWSNIQNTPEHSDAVIAALQESGMRAVFGYGPPSTSVPDWWFQSTLNHPEDVRRLATRYFASSDQLLTLQLAARGPDYSTLDVVAHDWRLARELGVRLAVHVGVSQPRQVSKLESMGRQTDLMGPDTTYIHCVGLNATEWKMIQESGGQVVVSCPHEMQMGLGMPPIQLALDHGLRPGMSVDIETDMPSDMFTQMRSVLTLQRLLIKERELALEENVPPLITTRDVLDFATIDGARTIGLDHKIGTLTPGKEADIIMLRADRANVFPINDPLGAVVMGMDTVNVDTVLIGGKLMKRHGELLNVDLNRVRKLAYESRDYVIQQADFKLPSF